MQLESSDLRSTARIRKFTHWTGMRLHSPDPDSMSPIWNTDVRDSTLGLWINSPRWSTRGINLPPIYIVGHTSDVPQCCFLNFAEQQGSSAQTTAAWATGTATRRPNSNQNDAKWWSSNNECVRRVLTRFCGTNFPSHSAPRPHSRGPTTASNHRWITHLNPSMKPWTPPKGLRGPSWPVLLTQMVSQARLPWRRPPGGALHLPISLWWCKAPRHGERCRGCGFI
jgi:hypothetical protein